MTDRPTPAQRKQIILDIAAEAIDAVSGSSYLHGRLASIDDYLHDCVIVHPDDVPALVSTKYQSGWGTAWQGGYNDCLNRIFAAAEEQTEIPTCGLCATYQHDVSYHEEPTYTPTELRARDEAIIRECHRTLFGEWCCDECRLGQANELDYDAIIAAAEEPDLPFRIAVRHPDETWPHTEAEPIDIAAAEPSTDNQKETP